MAWLWTAMAARGRDLSVITKFVVRSGWHGAGIPGDGGRRQGGGHRLGHAGPMWLVLTYLLHTVGELALSPVGMSATTRLAPRRFSGQAMGLWFTSLAMGNLLASRLAGELDAPKRGGMAGYFNWMFWFGIAAARRAAADAAPAQALGRRQARSMQAMNDPRQRRMLVLCLATVYLVWGTSYMATRVGVLHLPPLLFAGVRFLISGVAAAGRRVLARLPPLRSWPVSGVTCW